LRIATGAKCYSYSMSWVGPPTELPFRKFVIRREQFHRFKHILDAQGKDCPLLYDMAIIYLWSVIEGLMKDFLIYWFSNEACSLEIRESKQNFSNVELRRLPIEIISLVVGKLFRYEFKGCAIYRYEKILKKYGLTPSPFHETNTRKSLIELENTRHVIAHNAGLVNQRFLSACHWLPYCTGEPVIITEISSFNGH